MKDPKTDPTVGNYPYAVSTVLVASEVSGGVLGELEHPAAGTGRLERNSRKEANPRAIPSFRSLNTQIRADPKTILTKQQHESGVPYSRTAA